MSTLNNPFDSPEFSLAEMTRSINKIPNNYGRVNELGLMPIKPVSTRSIILEELNGVLNLLPSLPEGSPGTKAKHDKRKLRSFVLPHIPYEDVVLPKDVSGIREFGSTNLMSGTLSVVLQRLEKMRSKHAITLEHLRVGALKGIILDADGSTIYNLYDEFSITPKVVNFQLATATTDVKKKCLEVVRHIEDNLRGEVATGVHCLVDAEFFDALTGHAKVAEAYQRWQDGEALRSDMRGGFQFGGITFEEYRGSATDGAGTVRPFIGAANGHAFPSGTNETFETYVGPADFNETVNTLGLELYARQAPRTFNRGTDLHTQSNPLPLCTRPAVLVKLVAS